MRTFYIAVKFCHRYDLSPSYIVTELTCHRFDICHRFNCHRYGLSPIWPVSVEDTPIHSTREM